MADMCRCHVTSLKVVTLHVYAFAICLSTMHLDISCASDPRAQTPEMSTMGPYTMRYKRSVHRVARGSVCGSCCVNICQNKLLHLSWESWKSALIGQLSEYNGPYTMRYKRSVHRVARGSVCGSCCVDICQNKLLHLSWESWKSALIGQLSEYNGPLYHALQEICAPICRGICLWFLPCQYWPERSSALFVLGSLGRAW